MRFPLLFPLSLEIVFLSSLFPLFSSFLFFFLCYRRPATAIFLSSWSSCPLVTELEAGRTHTNEVGRNKAASPTLSSGASAIERDVERLIVFLLMMISVLSSYLFLSALPSTLPSLLAFTVISIMSHGSHGPWLAAEGDSFSLHITSLDWPENLPTLRIFLFCHLTKTYNTISLLVGDFMIPFTSVLVLTWNFLT